MLLLLFSVWMFVPPFDTPGDGGFTNQETTVYKPFCATPGTDDNQFTTCPFGPAFLEGYINPSIVACGSQSAAVPGASPRPKDQLNLYSIGVDPANLVPEGIDLNIFPSFPVSDQLALKPSLSFSPDNTLLRLGILGYGAPKRWRNHYGELVRALPRLDSRGFGGLGLKIGSGPERGPLAAEISTYFINATGQQINFYPESPAPGAPVVQPDHWFSEDGGYRLRKIATGFELDTPDGLVFAFESYRRWLDRELEFLSVHYRVKTIRDRFDNQIQVAYRFSGSVCDSEDCLQPDTVSAYKRGSATVFQKLTYRYDASDRLIAIDMPRPNAEDPAQPQTAMNGNIQSFEFRYSDAASGDLFTSGAATTGVGKKGNKVALNPLTGLDGGQPREIPVFLNGGLGIANIFLDLSDPAIGPLNSVMDFGSQTTLGFIPPGNYYLVLNPRTGSGGRFVCTLEVSRLNLAHSTSPPSNVYYRYQLDPGDGSYPTAMTAGHIAAYPDKLFVRQTGSAGSQLPVGEYNLRIYPAIKAGDLLVRTGSTQSRVITQAELTNLDPENLSFFGIDDGQSAFLLRVDNLARIAEIKFPVSATSTPFTQKRLVLEYDDRSLNHQEIRKVAVFDKANPIMETEYTYQTLRTAGTTAGLQEMNMLGPDNPTEPCAIDSLYFGSGTHAQAKIGLRTRGQEEEMVILRQKTVRFATLPGGPLDGVPLITHYGGSFRHLLVGLPTRFVVTIPPVTNVQFPDCDRVQWSLDGNLFKFTWQILPDGSAKVFDLSPDGLGVDPVFAFADFGKRVFKTYTFDTQFRVALGQRFPASAGLDGVLAPFFRFMPAYPPQNGPAVSVPALQANPDPYAPPGYASPKLSDFFSSSFRAISKCYQADITSFEMVPRYPRKLEDRWMPRETLGVIHGVDLGAVENQGSINARTSAIRSLDDDNIQACSGTKPSDPIQLAESFLAGNLCSPLSLAYTVPSGTLTLLQNVAWAQGACADYGNAKAPYFDRQKLLSLQPHFSYQARNLDGFTWDLGQNRIALTANHLVQGTRLGSGGYLGTATVAAATPSGATTLSVTGAPTGLTVGDVILSGRLFYRLTATPSAAGGNVQLQLSPAQLKAKVLGEPVEFFRYQNGADTPAAYRGYDRFGNNDYRETFYGGQSLVWSSQGDRYLLPDFRNPASRPQELSENDSTALINNDTAGWRYFGRVTTSSLRTRRPFWVYSSDQGCVSGTCETNPARLEGEAGFAYRMTTKTNYRSDYPWLPSDSRRYFVPHTGTIPVNNGEDDITEYTYFLGASNNAFFGMLETQKNYRAGSPSNFGLTRNQYDTYGRLSWAAQAAYKNGVAPYALRSVYVRDGNSGLVVGEEGYAGTTASGTLADGASISLLQQTSFSGYDRLGRATLAYQRDAAAQPLGPVTLTAFHSPMRIETEIREPALAGAITSGPQISLSVAFVDGLDRSTLGLRQNGTLAPVFASGTHYDDQGRVARVYLEAKTPITNPKAYAPLQSGAGQFAANGFQHTAYNSRGEAWGEISWLPDGNGGGLRVAGSRWHLWQQDALNAARMTQWTLQLNENENLPQSGQGEALSRVDIKSQITDVFGLLAKVSDSALNIAPRLTNYQELDPPAFTPAQLLLATEKSRAAYSYDFQGNLFNAEVGTGSPKQERRFKFDVYGRLRCETQPEIGQPIAYSGFNRFDSPTLVVHCGGTRSSTYKYDAYGNMTDGAYADSQAGMIRGYHENRTYSLGRFPGLLLEAFGTESANHGGLGFGYRMTHDPNNGRLRAREMKHNFPRFTTGFDSLTNNQWNTALKLEYAYDSLGRITDMTYPAGALGGGRTQLILTYSAQTALLDHIDDATLGVRLWQAFDYGPQNQILSYNYSLTEGDGFDLKRTLDPLLRLNQLHYGFGDGAAAFLDLDFGFDQASRIRSIASSQTRNLVTATGSGSGSDGFGYDPLGQLVQARVLAYRADGVVLNDPANAYQFQYDEFGNLKNRQHQGIPIVTSVNATNNRLTGITEGGITSPVGYYSAGEVQSIPLEGAMAQMKYTRHGRLSQVLLAGNTEDYYYDPFGMRCYKAETPSEGEKRDRLYFYDEGNMVLNEWVREGDTEHWDRTYLYVDQVIAMIYEYEVDAESLSRRDRGAAPLPLTAFTAPPVHQATSGQSPITIKWFVNEIGQTYDVQFAKSIQNEMTLVKNWEGINQSQILFSNQPGDYYYRVRIHSLGAWSDWQMFTISQNSHEGQE